MQLRKSERRNAKIKMALQAPSGAGKTYSSLLLAKGITNDLSKVAIIDTENGSADLYSHLGEYNVVSLKPPFSPEKYVQAIDICEKAEMELMIIDSASHCWEYLLDYHSKMAGNSFTNWSKIKPMEKELLNKILQSPCHIIATYRTKQDYVLNQKDGKYIPEKVGLKSIARDGTDFEFTLVFDLDIKHFATSSKDRTGLFMGRPEFILNAATGRKIKQWCESGVDLESIKNKIQTATTEQELSQLYHSHKEYKDELNHAFAKAQHRIRNQVLTNLNHSQNGITNSQQQS